MKWAIKYIYFVLLFVCTGRLLAADGYTQADRERDIRTQITLQEFMKSTDRRIQDYNQRLDDISKRFDDMNKRFDDVNKRFDDMNNRLQDAVQLLYLLITVFSAVAAGIFVYVVWDRKTFLKTSLINAREMVDEKLIVAQKESKLNDLLNAMRELANEDSKVKNALAKFNLL